jgi:hypothetical protein
MGRRRWIKPVLCSGHAVLILVLPPADLPHEEPGDVSGPRHSIHCDHFSRDLIDPFLSRSAPRLNSPRRSPGTTPWSMSTPTSSPTATAASRTLTSRPYRRPTSPIRAQISVQSSFAKLISVATDSSFPGELQLDSVAGTDHPPNIFQPIHTMDIYRAPSGHTEVTDNNVLGWRDPPYLHPPPTAHVSNLVAVPEAFEHRLPTLGRPIFGGRRKQPSADNHDTGAHRNRFNPSTPAHTR